jgi:hypothetical protein
MRNCTSGSSAAEVIDQDHQAAGKRRTKPPGFARRFFWSLEHDPKKWKPVFPRDKPERVCAEIMLKQRDEIMFRFHPIGT